MGGRNEAMAIFPRKMVESQLELRIEKPETP